MSDKVVDVPVVDQSKKVEPQDQKPAGSDFKSNGVITQDDGLVNKNKELLDELKKERAKRKELEDKAELDKQAELEKKGKFEELSKKQKEEIEKLKSVKDKADKYDEYFKVQLAKEMENVPDSVKDVINSMVEKGTPIDECLEKLASLKKDMGKNMLGIATERAGGHVAEIDINKYQGKDGVKNLLDLSHTNPELYKVVQERLKQRR